MSRWTWIGRLQERLAALRSPLQSQLAALLSALRGAWSRLPWPNLPGGARLWVSLASAGFLLAALAGNVQQLLQLSLDGQGWLWLLLGVGLSLLSLVVNGLAWGAGLRWLGHRPRWAAVVQLFLASNLRKYLRVGCGIC